MEKRIGKGFLTFIISSIFVIIYLFLMLNISIELLWNTLPDFLGGALGILLGYGFFEWIGETRDTRKAKNIRKMLKDELESCMKLVGQKGGFLLPTVNWRVLLSTGDLSLLPFDQSRAISAIYTIIENQNYESTQVRNTAIVCNAVGKKPSAQYLSNVMKRDISREQKTANEIKKILNENWWDK